MTVFHKSEPDWVEKVRDLKPGQGRRISDSKKVTFNGKGYFLWDFREKEGEVYEPTLTLREKLELIAQQTFADRAAWMSTELPMPALHHPKDWPVEARVWLHKAALSNADIAKVGAYWNARMRRVVLPYNTLDGDAVWIARSVDPEITPKYLFPAGVRRGGGALVSKSDTSPFVTITEDLLSAYRVMWASGFDAVAAQGTTLDRDALVTLARKYSLAFVWLDPDRWGQLGATGLVRKLGALGMEVVRLDSKVDPKLLTDQEIQDIMKGPDGRV